MPRTRKTVYTGWFLATDDLVYGYRDNGDDALLTRPKIGIPNGAMSFQTQAAAENELAGMRMQNYWPLWTPHAKAVQISWS